MIPSLSPGDHSRLIEMAWEDRTPFEAIETLYGLNEKQLVAFMRRELRPGSFRLWRRRMKGRTSKHRALRNPAINRGYCPSQYKHR
ncbi:MAG: TIGR03643 family protein [Oleiphilaceae bacterium]|nr:TIGR03643 family protein [Oleiphilaceae bacterium]